MNIDPVTDVVAVRQEPPQDVTATVEEGKEGEQANDEFRCIDKVMQVTLYSTKRVSQKIAHFLLCLNTDGNSSRARKLDIWSAKSPQTKLPKPKPY